MSRNRFCKSKKFWGSAIAASLLYVGGYFSDEISYWVRYAFANPEERRDAWAEREAIRSIRLQYERGRLENNISEISPLESKDDEE